MILGRFAPSPSGRMHLGNVFAAMLAWLSARSQGGEILLRIEDLDTTRCTDEKAQMIREDLSWLGLDWDYETTPQKHRTEAYCAVLEDFRQRGLVYPCWCTRGTLQAASAPHASDGHDIYPGFCRNLTEIERSKREKPPSWRLSVPDKVYGFSDGVFGRFEENLAKNCGDFVVRKADGMFAYQLAVVVDDAQSGVTEIVRGCDLLSSTPRQLYIYDLLGTAPPKYCHTPLLLASDGRRMSKRERDMDLGVLRKKYRPEDIIGKLAFLGGIIDKIEPVSAGELVSRFSWEKVSKSDIIVNEALF
ncbi:MAG: tRNA glutamyl-Q(34) synthetase GluQRS [Oscillospiraceae bacterium]|nr:tRNA glutamyl-Q(34) synthetase GluQRS [Oscillospiraceae bacterium]